MWKRVGLGVAAVWSTGVAVRGGVPAHILLRNEALSCAGVLRMFAEPPLSEVWSMSGKVWMLYKLCSLGLPSSSSVRWHWAAAVLLLSC